ncbi:MAG TPA: hypothetical protein VKB89_30295 [Xanthobacteraceae bacterium]|nr:hypothetical protein [Xanthobacteraceae bacterium]
MDFELHAPSMGVAATSLIVAMLALICYFFATPGNVHVPFWLAMVRLFGGSVRHHGKKPEHVVGSHSGHP